MKKGIRNVMAVSASLSLAALTGCAGMMGGEGEGNNGENAAEVAPALSEIADVMWGSMEESGSVTITADASEFAGDNAESAQMFEQMMGGDMSDIQFYGSLDETATGMRVGEEDLMRNFGENGTYISADAIFNMVAGQDLGFSDEEQQQFDDMAAEFSDTWFDYTSEMQSGGGSEDIDIAALFDGLQESWEGGDSTVDTPVVREEISDEGTHEVREEQDVWVYTGDEEGQELVLEANHDSPKFVSISDGEASLKFSGWGETEAPQQPEESQIMTEQDMQQQLNGTGGSGSSSDGGGSSDLNIEPDNTGGGSDSGSGSGTTNVPGVGTVDCDGPVPGDPGFTDPNGNYTDEEIQAFQDACNGSGSASSGGSGSSSDTVSVPGLGSFDCSGEIPGDPGVSTLDDEYTFGDLMAIYEACDRPGEPSSAMDNEG